MNFTPFIAVFAAILGTLGLAFVCCFIAIIRSSLRAAYEREKKHRLELLLLVEQAALMNKLPPNSELARDSWAVLREGAATHCRLYRQQHPGEDLR